MKSIRCEKCNKRLFDIGDTGQAYIEIMCPKCKKLNQITTTRAPQSA